MATPQIVSDSMAIVRIRSTSTFITGKVGKPEKPGVAGQTGDGGKTGDTINLSGKYDICESDYGTHASTGTCTQIGNRWQYTWRNCIYSGRGSGTVDGNTAHGDATGNTGRIVPSVSHPGRYTVAWSNGYTWYPKNEQNCCCCS